VNFAAGSRTPRALENGSTKRATGRISSVAAALTAIASVEAGNLAIPPFGTGLFSVAGAARRKMR
jgi:hypothetical protein